MKRIGAVPDREKKNEKRYNKVFTIKNSSCKGGGRVQQACWDRKAKGIKLKRAQPKCLPGIASKPWQDHAGGWGSPYQRFSMNTVEKHLPQAI